MTEKIRPRTKPPVRVTGKRTGPELPDYDTPQGPGLNPDTGYTGEPERPRDQVEAPLMRSTPHKVLENQYRDLHGPEGDGSTDYTTADSDEVGRADSDAPLDLEGVDTIVDEDERP